MVEPEGSDEPGGVCLTWRDVSIFVKVRQGHLFGKATAQPYKRLVNGVTGMVKGGDLVVLMGPSGAGKSTLMGALAYRSGCDIYVDGDIRLNGEPVSRDMHLISGFMHQDDLFVETLTVREHLEFMARLKLGERSRRAGVRQIVDGFLQDMGLVNCANTKIGRLGQDECISGGERKRLSFATEALTDPPILFCDEPTTGLDSFSALSMIKLMKGMSARGKTVLCTIHQPSSELFAMFEHLILLAEGRIVFMGRTADALEFFAKHGYACPQNYNPAEKMMQVLSEKSSDDRDRLKVKKLCDDFVTSSQFRQVEEVIAKNLGSGTSIREFANSQLFKMDRNSSGVRKIYWLTYRSILQVVRDPSVQTVRLLQKLGIALMASLCFYGTVDLTQAGVQSVQGAIFILVTENTFPPMYGVLPIFANEFPLILREFKSDLYHVHSYYIAKMISLIPGLVIEPILFVLVAYFIVGFKRTFYAFAFTNLISILTTNVAAACGCFFSNAFGSVSMALSFLVPLDYVLMVTSGMFMKLNSIPVAVRWFRYLSWFMYSNEALTIVHWENVDNITCEYKNPEIPCLQTGDDVLKKFDFSASHLMENLMAMAVLYVVFHILAYLLLRWRIFRHL